MKTNLRNPVFSLIACMLLALSIGFFSCEKTVDELLPSGNPAGYDDPGYELPPFVNGQAQNDGETGGSNDAAFSFELEKSYCSRLGTNVAVRIEFENEYRVRWEVDGLASGTGMRLNCVSGRKATAYVTRIAGDITLIKSIELHTAISPVMLKTKPKTFNFTLKLVPCSDGKVNVHIKILNPQLYKYDWKLNNMPAGHDKKLSCVCGNKAQVSVTRLSDGLTTTKSISLPICTAKE
ncbi:MAG: hypothetical protein EPO28_15060 [Saprospiraceae bacterium]|nr:MAG: hypothetical protein EPO28_15060 [Saprospiraceae bacterium]